MGNANEIRRHALIVIGGFVPDGRALSLIDPHHAVICADSGLDHARSLGLRPDVVVGDMDSVDPSVLARATDEGIARVQSSVDKYLTDTELAIEHALADGADAITVLWGGGDRIDHAMGVLAACSDPTLDGLRYVRLWAGGDLMHIARPHRPVRLTHEPGITISLMPLTGPAIGVSTEGLRWPLRHETLRVSSARGVSNVSTSRDVRVSVEDGTLAVVIPYLITGGLTS